MMGAGVGLTIGFIFGSYSILRCVFSCVLALLLLIPIRVVQRRRRSPRCASNALAVHARQCCDVLVLPCYRFGTFILLALGVQPRFTNVIGNPQ